MEVALEVFWVEVSLMWRWEVKAHPPGKAPRVSAEDCICAQASSVGFDAPAGGVTFAPVGQARVSRPRNGLDLSSAAAQRRASLELGMGGISHKSLLAPGGGSRVW